MVLAIYELTIEVEMVDFADILESLNISENELSMFLALRWVQLKQLKCDWDPRVEQIFPEADQCWDGHGNSRSSKHPKVGMAQIRGHEPTGRSQKSCAITAGTPAPSSEISYVGSPFRKCGQLELQG